MAHLSARVGQDNSFTLKKNMSKPLRLTVIDEDDGERVDLTPAVIYFTLKESLSATSTTIQKVSTDVAQIDIQDQTVEDTKGQALIFLLPTDTNQLVPGRSYIYDVVVVLGSDNHQVVENTEVTVKATVTNL